MGEVLGGGNNVDGALDSSVAGEGAAESGDRGSAKDLRRTPQKIVDAAVAAQERRSPVPPSVLGVKTPPGASHETIAASYRAACAAVGVRPKVGTAEFPPSLPRRTPHSPSPPSPPPTSASLFPSRPSAAAVSNSSPGDIERPRVAPGRPDEKAPEADKERPIRTVAELRACMQDKGGSGIVIAVITEKNKALLQRLFASAGAIKSQVVVNQEVPLRVQLSELAVGGVIQKIPMVASYYFSGGAREGVLNNAKVALLNLFASKVTA